MANDPAYPLLETGHARGTRRTTSAPGTQRGGLYGEQYVLAIDGHQRYGLCAEGSYFIATTPTPGTAIVGHAAATTLDDTKPLICVRNDNPASSGIQIVMDSIELVTTTAVGTNATDCRWAIKLDTRAAPTGGTALTPKNTNQDSSGSSAATITAGVLTAAAASSAARLVDFGVFRYTINVLADRYRILFGESMVGDSLTPPATVAVMTASVVPVIIGPGQSMFFHRYATAQSVADQFEAKVRFFER